MFAFDEPEFRRRAKERLLAEPPLLPSRSDNDLNALAPIVQEGIKPKPAAVLVPVIQRLPELTVLLTLRTEHLKRHSGQVAFPGGRIDEEDRDAITAALRETHEETGLSAGFIEPLGYLDGYLTGTGFFVTPVVAMVRPGFEVVPDPHEVAAVFEVPLRFLMTPGNHFRHSREWQGRERFYYAMPYEDRYIWGITAGMIKNLYDRMYATP
jgi:8-oxo-dGTP pyrophosphatase MutT (NUDIX family)